MFLNPLQHEFIGDPVQEFMNYFNTTDEVDLMENAQKEVFNLLKLYSQVIEGCQYAPRTQGDLYCVLCFLSVMVAKKEVDISKLRKFINWVFKGIYKQIYPITLKTQFETLSERRVNVTRHSTCKDFVIILENLYYREGGVWE